MFCHLLRYIYKVRRSILQHARPVVAQILHDMNQYDIYDIYEVYASQQIVYIFTYMYIYIHTYMKYDTIYTINPYMCSM